MESQEKKVERRFSRASDYKRVFVGRIYGGERNDHFEMIVESVNTNGAESQGSNKIVLDIVDEVSLKMSPEQAKSTYLWLGVHIAAFEKKFRPIKLEGPEGEVGKDIGFIAQ